MNIQLPHIVCFILGMASIPVVMVMVRIMFSIWDRLFGPPSTRLSLGESISPPRQDADRLSLAASSFHGDEVELTITHAPDDLRLHVELNHGPRRHPSGRPDRIYFIWDYPFRHGDIRPRVGPIPLEGDGTHRYREQAQISDAHLGITHYMRLFRPAGAFAGDAVPVIDDVHLHVANLKADQIAQHQPPGIEDTQCQPPHGHSARQPFIPSHVVYGNTTFIEFS